MTEKLLYKLIGYNCSMKCHRLYLIADFENFSPPPPPRRIKNGWYFTYGLQYGKCEWRVWQPLYCILIVTVIHAAGQV